MSTETKTPNPADALTEGWQSVSNDAAIDELQREINVRMRCFPRWIEEGRVSKTDAKDRLQRMIKAATLLQLALDTKSA
jgi:hypothetical protein